MWQAIAMVSSGLTLGAFLVASAVLDYRSKRYNLEKVVELVPPEDRANVAANLMDRLVVKTSKISGPKTLEPYKELLKRQDARSVRNAFLIALLAVLGTGVTIVGILKSNADIETRWQEKLAVEAEEHAIRELMSTLLYRAEIVADAFKGRSGALASAGRHEEAFSIERDKDEKVLRPTVRFNEALRAGEYSKALDNLSSICDFVLAPGTQRKFVDHGDKFVRFDNLYLQIYFKKLPAIALPNKLEGIAVSMDPSRIPWVPPDK